MKWFGPPVLFLTMLLLFAKCDNQSDRYVQAGWGDPVRQLDSTDAQYEAHCYNLARILEHQGGGSDGHMAIECYLDYSGAALLSQHKTKTAEKP